MIYPDNAATTSVGEKNGDAQAVGIRVGCEGEVTPMLVGKSDHALHGRGFLPFTDKDSGPEIRH